MLIRCVDKIVLIWCQSGCQVHRTLKQFLSRCLESDDWSVLNLYSQRLRLGGVVTLMIGLHVIIIQNVHPLIQDTGVAVHRALMLLHIYSTKTVKEIMFEGL